jgi:SNF2 family DNA or RNA helicase
MQFKPHEYQRTAIDRMIEEPCLAILMDPGLGKTSVCLTVIKRLQLRTLVVAPLDVIYRVWPREIQKWDHTQNIKYTVLHGPEKQQSVRRKAGVYIVNPAGLKWLHNYCKKNRYFPFDILIIDESTDFKNHKAKSFEAYLAPMLRAFKRRYILSGTPIAKEYLDLWSQYYILDLGARLGDNYYHYRRKFFYPTDRKQYNWTVFPGYEEKIQKLVADITIRVSGKDNLELPDVFYNKIEIPFTAKAQKAYREMAKSLLVKFETGTIATAANAAVKSNKLQCISNGFLYITEKYVENGKVKTRLLSTETIHTSKLDALSNIVAELNGNPLLVGYHYKHDLKMLLERFPDTPYYGSDINQKQKLTIERKWNDGDYPLLFAQIHSTAKGLNLQESGYHIFFYSLTWTWIDFEQFIKRIARQGQKSNRVIVHVPMMQKSIDNLIWDRLQQREVQSDEFLSAFVKHLKEV